MGIVSEIRGPVLGADPFAALAHDLEVTRVMAAARAEIDSVLWRREIRSNAAAVARASIERGGRDSAAIDGADTAAIDDSPMGRVLARAIDVTAAVPGQVGAWSSAPLQVIAALHAIAANDFAAKDELGRPRSQELADDALRIGQLPPAALVGPRMTLLAELVLAPTTAPAILVAGIVHAELLALRPFAWGSGLVARAAARCVLAERAVDPSLFTIPEHGMFTMGRPAYVDAVRAYASGTMAGSSAYLIWFATACALGAKAVTV